jgi:hypothetical protein
LHRSDLPSIRASTRGCRLRPKNFFASAGRCAAAGCDLSTTPHRVLARPGRKSWGIRPLERLVRRSDRCGNNG